MHARPMVHALLAPLLLPLALAACTTEEAKDKAAAENAAPGATTARADLAARAEITPTFGGSVLLAGDYRTELAVHEDGLVEGLVFGADAKALPHERVSGFNVVLALESGTSLPLTLSWDAAAARFHGRAALSSELVVRPIAVKLEVDGKAHAGVLEEYALLPALDVHAEANALADAKASADAKRLADAKMEAKLAEPSAKLSAKGKVAPKVSVDSHAKAGAKAVAKANARANAKAQLALPAPKVSATAKTSAATEPQKSGTSASVKAKASFGLGQ